MSSPHRRRRPASRASDSGGGVVAGSAVANDLAMIEAAGLGAAYHAKPIVAAAAAARIDHGNLTTLLYAQGIAKQHWVLN